MNNRLGSLAAPRHRITRMAAIECIADVRFEQKPIFDSPLSAKSGHSPTVEIVYSGP